MKQFCTLLALSLLLAVRLWAQPCTQKKYNWRVEKDLLYGKDVNYLGDSIGLRLDLYKPIDDGNTKRPLMVVIHGGYWFAGCKENVRWFAEEMAARGYVVAAVDYRKGWHKHDYVAIQVCLVNMFLDNLAAFKALYVADSAEHYRALYRGMQDVKGAIRWLKARADQDSVDHTKVFVGGESAGAFIALTVAFLDRPEEKPLSCGAIGPAPKPYHPEANYFEPYKCVGITRDPTGLQRMRLDLGPIEGRLNLNGHHTKVLGVFSFFGGVPYEALSKNWINGPDTPAIYLYHRTCDGVVPFTYGQPFDVFSINCNTGCDPWHYRAMHLWGNGAIANFIEGIPNPPKMMKEFFYCPPFDPIISVLECPRYIDNGSYHNILEGPKRAQNIANFFAPLACPTVATHEPGLSGQVRVQPNPFAQELTLWIDTPISEPAQWWLTDLSGRVVWSAQRAFPIGSHVLLEHNTLPAGVYVLHLRSLEGVGAWKVIRQ